MPLPLFLIGGAVLVGSAFNAAANAVNRDYELELESVNKEIREVADAAERSYALACEDTQSKIAAWASTQQEIQNGSFRRFVDLFSQLKNVEEEGSFSNVTVQEVQRIAVAYRTNSRSSSLSRRSEAAVAISGAITGLTLGAVAGGVLFAGKVIKGVKLQTAIEDAKAELARVKVKAKEVEAAEKQVLLIGRRADELVEVTRTLQKPFILALNDLEWTLRAAGTDYAQYTQARRRSVKLAYHFGEVMLQLLKAPLVEDNKVTRESSEVLRMAKDFVRATEAV